MRCRTGFMRLLVALVNACALAVGWRRVCLRSRARVARASVTQGRGRAMTAACVRWAAPRECRGHYSRGTVRGCQ